MPSACEAWTEEKFLETVIKNVAQYEFNLLIETHFFSTIYLILYRAGGATVAH